MIYDNICPYTWFLRGLSPFTIALWAPWTRTQAGSSEIFLGWLHWLIFSWLSLQSPLFEPFLLLSMFQIFLPNSLVLHKLCHLNLTLTICGQSSLQSRIVEFWFKRWRVEQQDALSIFADLTFYRGFHVPDSACGPPPPPLFKLFGSVGHSPSFARVHFNAALELFLCILNIALVYKHGLCLDASHHLLPHWASLCSNALGSYCSSNCLHVVFPTPVVWYYLKFYQFLAFI